ncbi:MAG: hypothetical protein D5R99_04690 [Methanocalculus sp. MSAO_Arc1]|uniref:hypothetical protein n=1 Tax=Methanocalculus TaxID=71151 RepID=UPI000FF2B077|nr:MULTISPECIES: hypothetical protein [unclassified Methanocalculus]MCP1661932.1 hypothetical protein [Methanocalculus sp. AMF5]RQD80553.1 MAG: hypothetical protein D5R99_04690 [Methanocalculus sp. MSAO_Arc1]
MRDSVRRLILFFGIIIVGFIFIFIELPVFTIVLIAFLVGVMLLFLTGSLSLSSLRLKQDTAGEKEQKTQPHEEEPPEPEIPKEPSKYQQKFPTFYNWYLKIKGLFPRRKKAGKKASKAAAATPEQKGTTADAAATGALAGAGIPEATDDAGDDPFGDISLDDLDEEGIEGFERDDAFSDLDEGGESLSADMDQDAGDMMDDVASILAAEGGFSDEEFEDEELQAGDSDSDMLTPDMDLDSIDLDSLEIEDEDDGIALDEVEEQDDEPQAVVTAPMPDEEELDDDDDDDFTFGGPDETIASNVGFDAGGETKKQSSFFSSSGGGGGEGDLLGELAKGSKNVKKKVDLSLVRDLKDIDVTASELEEELSAMVVALGGKKQDDEE